MPQKDSSVPNKAVEQWLDEAVDQMRWQQGRAYVRQELLGHWEDSKEAYLSGGGLTQQEAEEKALADLGPALETGRKLDRVHKPRPQWGWLGMFSALILLAGGLTSWQQNNVWPMFAGCISLLVFVLVYRADYTFFGRHALGFHISVFCGVFMMGYVFPFFGIMGIGKSDISQQEFILNVLPAMDAFSPLLAAGCGALLYYFRVYSKEEKHKMRWALLFLIPLQMLFQAILLMNRWIAGVPLGILVLFLFYFIVIIQQTRAGVLAFNPKPVYAFAGVGILLVAALGIKQALFMGNEMSVVNRIPQNSLRALALWGPGDAELLHKLLQIPEAQGLALAGWLGIVPAVVILLGYAGVFAWLGWRAWRMPNAFARTVGTGIAGAFAVQVVAHSLNCFVLPGFFPIPLPFLTPWVWVQVASGVLAGILMSIFRMGEIVRNPLPRPERMVF